MAQNKKKQRRKAVILSCIALVVVGLAGAAAVKRREPVLVVQTEKIARRNLTELVVANGKIQPVVQAVISPEVSGEIIELPVKEGQAVRKDDLLLRIKPDNYLANRNSMSAGYQSSIASRSLAKANLDKAELEFRRNQQLFESKLISDSQFLLAKTDYAVAQASFETSEHQVEQAKAALARAEDDLSKTTIRAPMDGTVINLKSQMGERVVGTAMMAGTEVMTVAQLENMEARVDIGEMDIVLIRSGQKARLEVDAFKKEKFHGVVTEIANAARTSMPGAQQEATKFQVKILLSEKSEFRPGMSVTAEIETRSRTNVLCVPIQSVTARLPKGSETNGAKIKRVSVKEGKQAPKPVEVVFVVDHDRAKMAEVKRGISDDEYTEITSGLSEGEEVVSGGYKVISRDLEDGKALKVDNQKRTGPQEKKST